MFSQNNKKAFQQQYQKLVEQIEQTEAEGSSSGELVTVKISGKHDLLDLTINPDCIDPEDPQTLSDLIKQAHEQAKKNLEAKVAKVMPNLGGMGM